MSQKQVGVLAWIIKAGLFILPASALIIAGNIYGNILLPGAGDLFFPFITGKNFFFRIVVEILLVFWIFAAAFDKKYRPKASPVLWALLATLAALLLATIFGENPYRSFWSNYERMEGLIAHLHLFAYFLILISVLKTKVEWHKFFWATVSASFLVASYAYFQLAGFIRTYQSGERLDATLGNATYLAIYIVFHLFILGYLFWYSDVRKTWQKYLAAGLFVFELPIVFFTATRGAILGLLGGFLLFGILLGLFGGQVKYRKYSYALVGLVIFIAAGFWMIQDTAFVKENYVLHRFVNLTEDTTAKARFTIWSMSWEGFKEHPLLGWGPENYVLLFNKYYKPEMWRQEPWFDRSHNVVFDWLISAGVVGLLAYASIFLAALYLLWFKLKDRFLAVLFTSLFAVYAFHNLFVFDNLMSYFMFFSVLGFIHFAYNNANDANFNANYANYGANYANAIKYVAPALAIVALPFVLYFANIKPILASKALIGALNEMNINYDDVDKVSGQFEKVFSLNTFGSIEAREQFALYANNITSRGGVADEKKRQVLSRAIEEMKKQVEHSPKDARGYMFLAPLYLAGGDRGNAIKTIEGALEAAPNKQQILFVATDVYLNAGMPEKALEAIRKAYELDTSYGGAAHNFAIIAVVTGHPEDGEKVLLEYAGSPIVTDERLATAYARIGRWDRVRDIWLKFIETQPQNTQYRANLASTYLNLGERQKAIEVLEEAIKANPAFKEQGEHFINEIRAGKNP